MSAEIAHPVGPTGFVPNASQARLGESCQEPEMSYTPYTELPDAGWLPITTVARPGALCEAGYESTALNHSKLVSVCSAPVHE